MSGSVPRPIEPKPIMTIGPVIVPCTGHCDIGFLQMAGGRRAAFSGTRRSRKLQANGSLKLQLCPKAQPAGRDRSSGGTELDRPMIRRKIARASGDHETSRRFQRTAFEFEPETARFIDGDGKRETAR